MVIKEPNIIVSLEQESDVRLLTQTVRAMCKECRFDNVDTEQMVLACSEIGHNAVRHGKGGNAQLFKLKGGKLIRVIIADKGPGISNIDMALREGYSTLRTSLGLGLEGAQRLADNFHIDSSPGAGTTVLLEKYRPLPKDLVDYGLVSVPDDTYNYNGDQYVLKEYDGDSLLIGVIDGPGQGYDAHSIAQTCKQFVENNYRSSLTELLTALNILMQESNDETGITCSLARLSPGKFSYAGLGDTHAYMQVDDMPVTALKNQEGRIGYVHKVKEIEVTHHFKKRAALILCSDGIKTINDGLEFDADAQHLTNVLFDNYHRSSGDATILIAIYNTTANEN